MTTGGVSGKSDPVIVPCGREAGNDATVDYGAESFGVVVGEPGRPAGVFERLVAVAGDPLERLGKLRLRIGV